MSRRWMLCLVVLAAQAYAAPPEPGSADADMMAPHSGWITTQHAPSGQWCCDLADGRPAELRERDGHTEVFYSREHWPDGNDEWILVPAEALLPQLSPLVVPIAWIMRRADGSIRVFCVAKAGAL